MTFRKTRVKFIWGASKVIQARWVWGTWGFYERLHGFRWSGLALSVRGLLIFMACLGLTAYVALMSGWYFWLDRNPSNSVTYSDVLLLPLRYDEIRRKQGTAMIENGLAALKEGHWLDAHMSLRAGLARSPGNQAGRIQLAWLTLLSGRHQRALDLMDEGLPTGAAYPGHDYLKMYFKMARHAGANGLILSTCTRYLKVVPSPLPTKERDWLRVQRTNAYLAVGDYEAAVQSLDGASGTEAVDRLRFKALLGAKDWKGAGQVLKTWKSHGGAEGPYLAFLAEQRRHLEDYPGMTAALNELLENNPLKISDWAYAIFQYRLSGLKAQEKAALEDYFWRFGSDIHNLESLSRRAADFGAVDVIQAAAQQAKGQGLPRRNILTDLARAQVRNQEWEKALKTFRLARSLPVAPPGGKQPAWSLSSDKNQAGHDESQEAMNELLYLITVDQVHPTEGSRLAMIQYLGGHAFGYKAYRAIAGILYRSGNDTAVREIIDLTAQRFPLYQGLSDLSAQVDEALQKKLAEAAPKTKEPHAEKFEEAPTMAELKALMAASKWNALLARIRDLRRAAPLWISRRDGDVLKLSIQAAEGAGQPLKTTLSCRLFLNGSPERSAWVLALAHKQHAAGEFVSADKLLAEVLRADGNNEDALALDQSWHPPEGARAEPSTH